MKLFLKVFAILFLLTSCNSQKKTIEEYQKEGYSAGIIEPSNSGDCKVIITMNNTKYDPINIDEEKFAQYATQKATVFFKFLPLRMKNRCEGVSPIRLIEVIKK